MENILPLSIADSLPEAFKEWFFTEYTKDHEQPIEQCQLCNQEDLRYHFEIKNKITDHSLMVGSHCILKFQVSVFDNGFELTGSGARKKLENLRKKMMLESCIKALTEVAQVENNQILRSALDFYNRNKYLTPKYAFVVFWRLKANNIDHSPSFFKINLNKHKYQDDLESMETSRVHTIWPALTSSQRQKAVEMGHLPPR